MQFKPRSSLVVSRMYTPLGALPACKRTSSEHSRDQNPIIGVPTELLSCSEYLLNLLKLLKSTPNLSLLSMFYSIYVIRSFPSFGCAIVFIEHCREVCSWVRIVTRGASAQGLLERRWTSKWLTSVGGVSSHGDSNLVLYSYTTPVFINSRSN